MGLEVTSEVSQARLLAINRLGANVVNRLPMEFPWLKWLPIIAEGINGIPGMMQQPAAAIAPPPQPTIPPPPVLVPPAPAPPADPPAAPPAAAPSTPARRQFEPQPPDVLIDGRGFILAPLAKGVLAVQDSESGAIAYFGSSAQVESWLRRRGAQPATVGEPEPLGAQSEEPEGGSYPEVEPQPESPALGEEEPEQSQETEPGPAHDRLAVAMTGAVYVDVDEQTQSLIRELVAFGYGQVEEEEQLAVDPAAEQLALQVLHKSWAEVTPEEAQAIEDILAEQAGGTVDMSRAEPQEREEVMQVEEQTDEAGPAGEVSARQPEEEGLLAGEIDPAAAVDTESTAAAAARRGSAKKSKRKQPSKAGQLRSMPMEDALGLFEEATPTEKKKLVLILAGKISSIRGMAPSEQSRILARFRAAMADFKAQGR